MATITLKNIPEDLYEELRESARAHHRSINGELISFMERILRPTRLSAEDELAVIRAARPDIPADVLSLEEIEQAIEDGRP
jgi:plasmid stability protein